jgi:phage host-nuclease inhibitor protein Gam
MIDLLPLGNMKRSLKRVETAQNGPVAAFFSRLTTQNEAFKNIAVCKVATSE